MLLCFQFNFRISVIVLTAWRRKEWHVKNSVTWILVAWLIALQPTGGLKLGKRDMYFLGRILSVYESKISHNELH